MSNQKTTTWQKFMVFLQLSNIALFLFWSGRLIYQKWPRYEVREQIISIRSGGENYLDTKNKMDNDMLSLFCDDRITINPIGAGIVVLTNKTSGFFYLEGTPKPDEFGHCYIWEKVRIN